MLQSLAIRDFAVIARAEMRFGPGMTVISGETGAGKSLLVDALGLVCGARADAAMVRHGAARAELEAEFTLGDCAAAREWLSTQELDDGESCQLRRVLRADGGSKAWINGRAVTLAQLGELAGLLVEIHGQHAHQALMHKHAQLKLLDALAQHPDALAAVRKTALAWREARQALDALAAAGESTDRQAWLAHQLQELDGETLDPDAQEALFARHRLQSNSAGLLEATSLAQARLHGDEEGTTGALDAIAAARALLLKASGDEPRLTEATALLDSAAISLEEAGSIIERVRDEAQADPSQLDALDRQIARLHDLARKHRVPVAELALVQQRIREELDNLANLGERQSALERQLQTSADSWRTATAALTASRQATAIRLGEEITALMATLGMAGGRFDVQLEPRETHTPDTNGAERVELLVAANPGQPARPLRKVASGGELSRIALAIQVAAVGGDARPTMVFDEVDTGISGAVAAVVGQLLQRLGERCQVMCVTHLPQVAAHGHAHYRVAKATEEGLTQSALTVLGGEARVEELARLLGGATVTPAARAAAAALLEDALQA